MITITEVKVQERRKNRVNIYVDGKFFCGASAEVAVKNGLKSGMVIDEQRLKEICHEADVYDATEKATKLVCKMLKTQKEVEKYLQEKGFDDEVVNLTINKLKEYKYINDENFIASYISTYTATQGINKMKQNLFQKGIEKELIETAFNGYNFDKQALQRLAEKYVKGKDVGDIKVKSKLYNHLMSKGFTGEQIKSLKYFRGEWLE